MNTSYARYSHSNQIQHTKRHRSWRSKRAIFRSVKDNYYEYLNRMIKEIARSIIRLIMTRLDTEWIETQLRHADLAWLYPHTTEMMLRFECLTYRSFKAYCTYTACVHSWSSIGALHNTHTTVAASVFGQNHSQSGLTFLSEWASVVTASTGLCQKVRWTKRGGGFQHESFSRYSRFLSLCSSYVQTNLQRDIKATTSITNWAWSEFTSKLFS